MPLPIMNDPEADASTGSFTRERLEFVRDLADKARLQVEAHDPYTKEHSIRVAHWAKIIGNRLPTFDKERLVRLEISAIIHDYGKIDIPAPILNKPSRLTQEEFERVKIHPETGSKRAEVMAPYVIPEAILCHHVHFDGGGYPNLGLQGNYIPIEARIIAVADVFDAITSDRCYRKGQAPDTAIRVMKEIAGTQLDAHLVQIFDRYYQTQRNLQGRDIGFATMTIDAAIMEEIRLAKRFLRKAVGDYDPESPLAKVPNKDAFVRDAIAYLTDLNVSQEKAEKFVRYTYRLHLDETFRRDEIDLSDDEYRALLQASLDGSRGHKELVVPLKATVKKLDYMDVVVFNKSLWNYVGDGKKVILMK